MSESIPAIYTPPDSPPEEGVPFPTLASYTTTQPSSGGGGSSARSLNPEGQVAGHGDTISVNDENSLVKRTYQQEKAFYESLHEDPELRDFVPRLYDISTYPGPPPGTKVFRPKRDKKYVITIENLTRPFRSPSVLDLKLGSRLYEDDASPIKKLRMSAISRITTSFKLGIAISGMRVSSTLSNINDFQKYSKSFGKKQTTRTLPVAFSRFFPAAFPVEYRRWLVQWFLTRVDQLAAVLATKELRIVGGSLLFVYEGDLVAWAKWMGSSPSGGPLCADDVLPEDLFDIRLIDFAHAKWTPGQGPDTRLLDGLQSARELLADYFESISEPPVSKY
ncbi:hypothetical protein BJ085DRAFT_24035 [Dimargaris cristalligena]|uniref:Kinase n=1 Tax=Dimargaris cristalligena TaxID=215637 RepID=A0A4P9ZZ93_9FUNG|nr:hypothetical protein BJ085DRAFT_24035 [Dimargaris cristalligena]|eukprot:RKP38411.1 hypothetical protein BJ085DRAFT_24035 [Dimargaris cristalligena]